MNNIFRRRKGWRTFVTCLLMLLMLASLCVTAAATNTDTEYHTMETVVTLDPSTITATETSNRAGTVGDFTWSLAGPMTIINRTLGDYTGKTFAVSPGMFKLMDTNGTLHQNHAVSISADFYFETLPTQASSGTTSPDPTASNFEAQLIMAWEGLSGTGTTMTNGIRMDANGNLYLEGLKTPLGYQISAGKWYNLKLIYSDYNKMEFWANGERISTVTCQTRYSSTGFYFFNSKNVFTAHVKNIEIAASKDTYYLGTVKEHSSDFISYQTTKPEANGAFNLRVLAGLDSLEYKSFGYRVLVLTKDESGNTVTGEHTGTDTNAYSSVFSGSTEYSIKDYFGYEYACLATITGLDANKDFFQLVIFPYTVSLSNEKAYGEAMSLTYAGESDADGYPVLNIVGDNDYTEFTVTDDTFIYRGWAGDPFGATKMLQAQNVSTDIGGSYRAAYFKFTIPAEDAAKLSSVTAAYLRIHSSGTEANADRVARDLCVYGAPINWDEDTLVYKTLYPYGEATFPSGSGNGKTDLIATIPVAEYAAGTFFAVDILNYIKAQTANSDGSITVAFCVTHPNNLGSDTKVVYLDAKENGDNVAANIRFEHSLYGRSFSNIKANNEGYEPLAYAEKLVDEWFNDLHDKIYPTDADGNLLTYEIDDFAPNGYGTTTATGDFQKPIMWEDGFLWRRTDTIGNYSDTGEENWKLKSSEWNTDRFARTLSTLGISAANQFIYSDYATQTAQHDVYGGITNAGFTGTETGFFHTEYINGRTYIIDPLGYPFFATSVNTLSYGENTNLQNYSAAVYGDADSFYETMSAELKDMGIYATFASEPDDILGVENGLATTVPINGVSAYMATLGRSQISEGQFPHNNTINVFDPDFVTTTYEKNAEFIMNGGYATNPRVLGYTADNELPSSKTILESYLTIDPNVPDNAFSYHTAWEWFARRTGNDNPTILDYYNYADKATLNSEFLGFIYARNYKTIRESIENVDKNHMYMGSRVAGECRYDVNYLKAAGYYLDVITTNLYDGLNPDPEVMTNYYRYAGIPFIVTEFYAKAMDAIDANGYMMTNSTGAGFVVMTQQERANYYEHFVLSLLESKACVGWSWYRFRDNDQGLWATADGKYADLRMLFVSYGNPTYPVTYADADGNVYSNADLGVTTSNWKTALVQTYEGEPMASNQNCNKGLFNANYSTTVAVYTYDASGNLTGVNSYEVDDSTLTAIPANGTTLTGKNGMTFTLGTSGTTKTVLTTYKGKYLALTDSIKNISANIMGIVNYLDADGHIQ